MGKILKILYTVVLYTVLFTGEMAAIYYLSDKIPFLSAVVFGLSFFVWRNITPHVVNSDPAGNGMERGFLFLFNIVISLVFMIIYYLLIKFFPEQVYPWIIFFVAIVFLIEIWLFVIGVQEEEKHEEWRRNHGM